MGKTLTFLSVLLISSCFLVSTAQQTGCLDEKPAYDIVFLVDSSSSIGTRDFREVKTFMHTFVDGLDIDTKNVQVGLAQFNNDPHKEFLLGDYANKAELFKKIDNLPYRTGGTYMGKAINFLKDNYFTRVGGSRIDEKVPQIVVLITDGDSTDDIQGPARDLRQKGIIIFAIAVGATNMTELKAIANSPPERFVLNIENYQALQGLTTTMKETVCVLMRDQGKALAPKFADVFVLVDSSSKAETRQIRELLNRLAVQLNVGDGSHKIALAQFGENVVKEFLFNDYQATKKVTEYIKRFELRPNGERKIGKAIDYVRTQFLNMASGSRIAEGYKQYLLVLRTGNSDDVPERAIQTIKNQDVTVIDIRLQANLRYMSPTLRAFQIDQNIVDVVSDITKRIQEKETRNVTGDCRSAQVADIVFIVDESSSITRINFELMKRFLHHTISGLEMNPDSVRVGMVLYNDRPRAEFYLDSFDNKKDILDYIKIIRYRGGGTATGAALKFAKDNLFIKNRGSRKALGVKQIAVVITDGKSQDNVTNTATELRRSGVTVYALGVKNASREELIKMASYPERQFVFNVDSFQMLSSLEKSLRKSLCKVVVNRGFEKNNRFLLKKGCVNTEEADIYFLLDYSGRTRADFEDVKKFILGFLQLFNIGPNRVRVGVAKVDRDPTLQFSLTEHKNRASLEAAVRNIIQPSGGTETGKALSYVARLFNQAKASRSANVQEILIVITDKESQDDVSEPAAELSIQGVSVYAIGVKDANQDELFKMTTDETKTFYVTNYDALNAIKSDIVTDICSQEACKNSVADIMFLIDGSSSIYIQDFTSMKTFITKVVNGTVIGEDNVHIGVVQFSNDPKHHFALNRFYDKDEVEEAINDIEQLTGDTYTGKALSFISKYFDATNGGRPDVPQFLIVITDGEAHDAVAIPAKAIRDKGVTIFSIGVGNSINDTQLREISGTEDKVYKERDFEALQSIEKNLQFKLCSSDTGCESTQLADVIFLVQCVRQIRLQDFENIKNFLISVVNSTQIGDNLVRIGVIVYTDTPNQFSLNQHNSKRQLLEAITTLKSPTGNGYTAKALRYSLDYFSKANGGRQGQGIPQMLFVITDGNARDQVNLRARADEFAAKRINVYGIGVDRAQDSELEMITKNKNKIFHVDNYAGLQDLQKNISGVLCSASKPECQNEVADLVFLIDGSESISEESWTTMIAFLLNVVNKLRITPELFRIGVAQFSSIYQKEFYMNEYKDADGVKSAIQRITQIKEGTLIGKALRNVVEFFQESKGSRKKSRVPQNLVLITDGVSSDRVNEAADDLRRMQINVFVIGIGSVSLQQLSYIAGSPDRLFKVQNFNYLNLTTATFVDSLCAPVPLEQASCTVDIGIGFDNSRTSLSSRSIFKDQKKLQAFLPDIIQYISVVHNLCCITQPILNTKVGFRLVDADGTKRDDFSFEEYNKDVVQKVMALQTSQALQFNTQLLRSFEEKFRASNSYVKVLIIFTDGLDEPVEDLQLAIRNLKTSGVKALLTVALDGFKSTADLQRLEFGRGMRYKQLLSIGMQNVASVMQKEIDTVVSRECCNVLCKCTGYEGPRGNQGPPGAKGSLGLRGLPGYPGEEGTYGERGPPGLNGTRGHQGCIGRRGVKGGRGYRGDNGDMGEDGLNGVNGEQGVTGAAGSAGERGDAGSPGPRGIRGSPGTPGQRGLRGDPGSPGLDNNRRGPKGDIGSPGIPGEPGPDGTPGQIGDNGRSGPSGRRGSAGLPGTRGPPGEPGQRGLPGASGPLGAFGPPGPVGQKGFLGLPGPQGSPGSPGRPGTKGSLGSRGQKGQPGDPGDRGALGPPGPRGLPGKDGADGYGFPGLKGQKGDSGFPGYTGLQGELGIKGGNGGGGPKGNRGRGGNAGRAGQPGDPGSEGVTGHRGPKGPRGSRQMSDCQLITYVRDNCVCCKNNIKCPAYPTDLVIGMDMSEDVTPQGFERMRSVVLRLLDNINVAESSCPTGARVSVVSYSSYSRYLIRFNDYHRKKQLIELVNNIALERTSNRRNIGAAMRFVGRNVLKRVRKGVLMRKVAIFLSSGESEDSTSLTTAILEYKALNIKLGVIALRNSPTIRTAFEADETKSFIFTVLGRVQDQNATLSKIQSCVICFDPCRPSSECVGTNLAPAPQELDMDLAVIVDGSRSILADEYEGVKEVLGGVLDQIAVSSQPNRADSHARVAVYQQSSTYTEAQSAVKTIFGFQQFSDRDLMKRSIFQDLKQTGGTSRLAFAMEYAVMQGILTAPKGRKNKMVLVIVGEEMASQDRAKLDFISRVAKCEGIVIFTLTVGDHISSTQVDEFASYPLEQHIIHLGHLKHGEQEYTQRFMRTFFHILSKNVNSYPHPSLQSQCSNFQRPDQRLDYEAAERPIYRVPVPSTEYPNLVVEEEMEEEDTAQEETEDQLTSGRGDSLVESPTDRTDSLCHLNSDPGTVCGDYIQQWYYKEAVAACLPFWYGGCDGNSNRFSSEKECLLTCGKQNPELILQAKEETALYNDPCLMNQDGGSCSDYILNWYYDIQQNECIHFWYGGCGGNKNRFNTQEECEALCLKDI